MSHAIDMSNDRANMAYVGETPWHGLGKELPADSTIEEWKIAAGLDWTIETSPVYFNAEYDKGNSIHEETFVQKQVPDRLALYRSDTLEPLSIMSDSRYKIVQPGEVLEFYRQLVEGSRFTIETAGSLKGGKKIWALARSNLDLRIMGQDLLRPYLLMATACDGTMSTVFDPTTVRVVCQNTLHMAVGASGKGAQIRIPHSREVNHDAVLRELGYVDDALEEFATSVDSLAERKVGDEEAVNYFVELFAKKNTDGQIENAPTVEKMVNKLMEGYKGGPGANLTSAKGTAWGLVNAITHYYDHERGAHSPEGRFNSSQFGSGANQKAKAFDKAMALAA